MYEALFKNRWSLLAFLVITLAGVQLFVGEGSGLDPAEPEQLASAASQPPPSAVDSEAVVEEQPNLDSFYSGAEDEVEEAYVEDEELIDTAEGFDPTPEPEEEFDDGPPEDLSAIEEDFDGKPVP